ncbi:MAG: DUF1849 family protein [Alphaproteobacteria bacterium]|nr:DUF1849 family protein [Alphaproteobacteria bacterium]
MRYLHRLILILIIAAPTWAAKAPEPAKSTEIKILPHRAFYTLKLESSQKDSHVKNTDGRMIIELSHDCNGWTLRQESASVTEMKNQDSEIMRSVYTATESDDGKILDFMTERVFNEEASDSVQGSAVFTEAGGTISYKTPESKSLQMKKGTIAPITHMKKLIQSAREGTQSLSLPVFDGSFYGNPVQIDAFIGPEKGDCKITSVDEIVYPMNLAVYATPSQSSNPNFEIKQRLGSNGITCSYEIDFGDHTVKGTLDRVELLPQKACEPNKSAWSKDKK